MQVVKVEEAKAQEKADAAKAIKDECEAELSVAMPILQDALSALDTIKEADVSYIKKLGNPPGAIKVVMEAVCVILGVKPAKGKDEAGKAIDDWWKPSVALLNEKDFLQKLKGYDKDNIPPKVCPRMVLACVATSASAAALKQRSQQLLYPAHGRAVRRARDVATDTRHLDRLGQLAEFAQESNTGSEQGSNTTCVQVIDVIRKKFTSDASFTPELAKKASAAAEGMCKWVHAMDKYENVAKVVAPKQAKLAEAEAQFAEVMVGLRALQADLKVLQDKLDSMEASLAANTGAPLHPSHLSARLHTE